MKNYDDKAVKKSAEGHGAGMPDFGIGHVTPNAMRKDWHQGGYALGQDGNGSMNYMAEKNMIHSKDEGRIRKHKAKIGNAV
jgi:hypothetical protein